MPSKRNKHRKYRVPQEEEVGGVGNIPIENSDKKPERPPAAEERAAICAQAIVDAQVQSGVVTQDGMLKMFLRQLLEHEDCAYDRVIRLARHMATQDGISNMSAEAVLLALATELESIKQPPPPAQPGVYLP